MVLHGQMVESLLLWLLLQVLQLSGDSMLPFAKLSVSI